MAESILLFGTTNSGKTAQLGDLAKHHFFATGGRMDKAGKVTKAGEITRLYTVDPGGFATIQHLVNLGIIDAVDLRANPRPWEAMGAAVRGKVWDGQKWTLDERRNAQVGIFAFEGITTWSDKLLRWLADEWGKGILHFGGRTKPDKFVDGSQTVAGNSEGHYGGVQGEVANNVQVSFQLPGRYHIWTAHPRRPEQEVADTVIGPEGAGKALTAKIPSWFLYTFRLMAVPPDLRMLGPDGLKNLAEGEAPPAKEHRLYMTSHKDMTSGGATGLGNDRVPLDATPLPAYIVPASLVKALELVKGKVEEAQKNVVAELQA